MIFQQLSILHFQNYFHQSNITTLFSFIQFYDNKRVNCNKWSIRKLIKVFLLYVQITLKSVYCIVKKKKKNVSNGFYNEICFAFLVKRIQFLHWKFFEANATALYPHLFKHCLRTGVSCSLCILHSSLLFLNSIHYVWIIFNGHILIFFIFELPLEVYYSVN